MSGLAVGVFGVPGVGKSTLLQAHVARWPRDRHIPGSSIIKAVIAPASVREMDQWPPARRANARAQAIERLVRERNECRGALLVDGHFSLRNRVTGELQSVVTPEDRAFYDVLILIDAPAAVVLGQVQRDPRLRPSCSLDAVAEHLERERVEAARTVAAMGIALLTIDAPSLDGRQSALEGLLERVRGPS